MADAQSPTVTEAAPQSDGNHSSVVGSFLRQYHPVSNGQQRDLLAGRYQIIPTSPLPDFNQKNARAFVAIDKNDDKRQLFALVCQPGTVQRNHAIAPLKANPHPNLLTLVASGAVALSQPAEERLVLVYERPPGKKLSALLAEHTGAVNELFICNQILAPLTAAIHHLEGLSIPHGGINLDTIYFDTVPVLGDCICEPCGYSQPFCYESLERMQSLPAGKGEGDVSQDYYALAVLTLHLLFGAKHFAVMRQDELIKRILHEGPYNALLRNETTSERFSDFLKGLLTLHSYERWNYENIKEWLDGRRSNMLHITLPVEAVRPMEFAGGQYATKRELAHAFFTHWDDIYGVIENSQLIQWIANGLRNKELGEAMQRVCKSAMEVGKRNEAGLYEQMMRAICLLDPAGPIRIGTLAMNADGLSALAAELHQQKAEKELQLITRFIEYNMISFPLDTQRKIRNHKVTAGITTILARLDRLRMSIRNNGLGFGLERVLYELNPNLPCQSPLFAGQYIADADTLLSRLDAMASANSGSDPIDRHIAAFIACKLNIQHEQRLSELSSVPNLAASRSVMALQFLALAQRKSNAQALPGLAHWLAARILPLLDVIHSRSLRNELKNLLVAHAESGLLTGMSDLIIHADYASSDSEGYKQARQDYKNNVQAIADYRSLDMIRNRSAVLGLSIAKLLAYVTFVLSLFSAIGVS